MKKQLLSEEFKRMQKLAGIITESSDPKLDQTALDHSNTSPNTPPGATPGKKPMKEENNRIKQISDTDMYSIKEPNTTFLANDEKPFPLSQEELKPIKDASSKPNIAKFRAMTVLGPDMGTLSLKNKKYEQRILKFFKSDKDNYYITVVGPGETSSKRTKHYTTDDKSAFIEFINKVINEFSDWCDNQS